MRQIDTVRALNASGGLAVDGVYQHLLVGTAIGGHVDRRKWRLPPTSGDAPPTVGDPQDGHRAGQRSRIEDWRMLALPRKCYRPVSGLSGRFGISVPPRQGV